MTITTKNLPVALTIVALSFQVAFAVDGKTPCNDNEELQSSSVKITLSATDQAGAMRGDDGSWWWQPSNGEPPFRLFETDPTPEPEPAPEPAPEPEPEPKPDRDQVPGDGDHSLSLDPEICFFLEMLMKDGDLTCDEACESVLLDIILPSEDDENEFKRPTFGPHIITCDTLFGSQTPSE